MVVMTHGIASTRFFLLPLAARLRGAGFAVRLYGYPSLWWSNETFGKRLADVHVYCALHDRVEHLGGTPHAHTRR